MNTGVKAVTRRPYGTQQQWDAYVERKQTRRALWRLFKIGLVSIVVFGVLVVVAAPLAFG